MVLSSLRLKRPLNGEPTYTVRARGLGLRLSRPEPDNIRERKNATQRKYERSAKGQATQARYNTSAKGRTRTYKYTATEACRILKDLYKSTPQVLLRERLRMQEKRCSNLGL